MVEDDKNFSSVVKNYVERFMSERELPFKIQTYVDGLNFIENFKNDHDIVFMDIDMPIMNGLEAAKKLRLAGSNAKLIFVTNLARYAIKGYEVDAMGFLVKPINYFALSSVLKKAIESILLHKEETVRIVISNKTATTVIPSSTIMYVEVQAHDLLVHTEKAVTECRKTLKEIRELLTPVGFLMCNNCYLVNLKYVSYLSGDELTLVNGEKLLVSRRRKKEFMDGLLDYMR